MTAPARIKQADVRRVVKGLEGAGLSVGGVKISPDGTVTILTGGQIAANDRRNPLDRLHG